MEIDKLLEICWYIANAEAKHLGAREILPLHFLLAVMKIIDPKFPEMLDKMNIASDEWARMCKEAVNIRHFIDVLPNSVTRRRHKLRARLTNEQVAPPITQDGLLHRSAELKRAFRDACLFEEGKVLHLKTLVQSLFELELVSLNDIA